MKKFQAANSGIALIVGAFVIVGALTWFVALTTTDALRIGGVIAGFGVCFGIYAKSRYFTLSNGNLLFHRAGFTKTIPLSSIREIEVTHSFGEPFDLRIYWGDGQMVHERLALWNEKTLVALIQNILRHTGHVKVSKPYDELLSGTAPDEIIGAMKRSQKKATAHLPWALSGAVFSIILFTSGFYLVDALKPFFGQWPILIFPTSIASAVFFMAYATTGKLKTGLWAVIPLLLFYLWVGFS